MYGRCFYWTVLIVFIVYICFDHINSFPPQPIRQQWETRSVKDILNYAINQAAILHIKEYELLNDTGQGYTQMLKDFFGQDADSEARFRNTISEITEHANEIQLMRASEALVHVNGEQIELAHHHVRALRNTIKTIASSSRDIDLLQEKIGQALHTIIAFYAETNWIEMGHNSHYEDFGKDNVTLMSIAGSTTMTCSDCNFTATAVLVGSCDNNLLVSRELTSGYRSDQDISKPVYYGGNANGGKCSRGSFDDTSRSYSATGGIYKGFANAANAPHYKLHFKAANVAIKAARDFLLSDDGVLGLTGPSLFRDIIHLKKVSRTDDIAFVVDTTGSMANDIVQAKDAMINIVTSLPVTNLPDNYILATFNDPDDKKTFQKTTNAKDFIDVIDSLSVDGGGDCAEYAIGGAILAAENMAQNSYMLLITDAIAKDYDRQSELDALLHNKGITLDVILSEPVCTSRRKRRYLDHARQKRQSSIPGLSVYDSIALNSGGSIHRVTTNEISDVIQNSITERYPSSTAMVQFMTISASMSNSLPVFVDNSIYLVKIKINGPTVASDVILYKPDGSITDFSVANSSITTSINAVIISLTSPTSGQWRLLQTASSLWEVNITAQTSLDFNAKLYEQNSGGYFYALSSNPISGSSYQIALEVYNLDPNATVSHAILLSSTGDEHTTLSVNGSFRDNYAVFVGETVIETHSEYIKLNGTDSDGNVFSRISKLSIKAVHVELHVYPPTSDLILNKLENVSFTITNYGAVSNAVNVTVSDDKGYTEGPRSFVYNLSPNETITENVQIQGTTASDIMTLTILVTEESTNSILQQYTKKLLI